MQHRHTTPSGPMTRARVKSLHDKVNSLLSMCDLDTPLNGLLLHSDTLCILRHDHLEDLQGSVEVGQESSQEVEGEGEKNGNKSQAAVLPPVAAVLRPRTSRARRVPTIIQPSQKKLGGTTAPAVLPPKPPPKSALCSFARQLQRYRSGTTAGPGGTTAGEDFRTSSKSAQRYYRWLQRYYRCGGNLAG